MDEIRVDYSFKKIIGLLKEEEAIISKMQYLIDDLGYELEAIRRAVKERGQ